MSDRMYVIGKDGRIRYIIEDDSVIDALHCEHEFEDEFDATPCIYCNLYPDEINLEPKEKYGNN
jgi:hypothetical protein